ncbi:hypothetical protein HMPREF1396_00955 [Helicobacter pylori GAM114Ai]|nr:hypothetical protein HMPREF1396_00955 [Helicobacter pylori GAM114Ai]
MFKGILVFLMPIVLIVLVLTAIRAIIMAFRGDTDGFLVEYGINLLNISAIL